jgi:hypothetical protein
LSRSILKESQGAVSTRELFGPEKSGPSHFLEIGAGRRESRRPAFLARAPVPQKLPGIDPQVVVVIEMKLDRVLTHAFRRGRLDRRLEHRQRPRRKFRRLSRLLMRLGPRFIAKRTGTCIPQEWKGIMRAVAVFPLDIETRPRAQIHLHRLRVCRSCHEFSIAQRKQRCFPNIKKLVKPPEPPNFAQLPDSITNIILKTVRIYPSQSVILVLGSEFGDFPSANLRTDPQGAIFD